MALDFNFTSVFQLMESERKVTASRIIAGSKDDPANWIDRLAIIFR